MIIKPVRTRRFLPKESLVDFIGDHVRRPAEGTILVVTSKIVALSQGRIVACRDLAEKERIIRKESRDVIRTPWCWLTKKNGEWCANAGVDESNAKGQLILLPMRIDETARALLRALKTKYKRKHLGVIITDTRIYPMRVGTMGVAVGFSGFEGIRSYIGEPDLYGRLLKTTTANVVHALAVASVLAMGEGNESQPLAVVQGAPVVFTTKKQTIMSLTINPCKDLYQPVYEHCGRMSRPRAIRRIS